MWTTAALVRIAAARSWKSLVFLAVLTTVTFGFVLTAATAARRSATSYTRLLAATDSPQVLMTMSINDLEVLRADLAQNVDVAAAGAMTYLPASPVEYDSGIFTPIGPGFGETVVRPIIVHGRRADPDRAGELMVNEALAATTGLRVGSHTRLKGPFGIDQPVEVVGIYQSPLDVGPNGANPGALGTVAFSARWFPVVTAAVDPGALRPSILVRLRPGTDAERFISTMRASHPEVGIEGPETLAVDVADGLRSLSSAYWVLAFVAGVASLSVLLLVSGRATRTRAASLSALGPLGATRWQRALIASAPETGAVVIGALLAPMLAIALSPLTRTGFARAADPERGVWFDAGLLAGLTVAGVVLLGAATIAQGRRAQARDRHSGRARHWFGSAGLGSPALFLGSRGAFGSDRGRRRQAGASLAGTAIALAGVIGVLTWSASVDHLLRSPRLYGWDFDAQVTEADADHAAGVIDAAAQRLDRAPADIAGIARVSHFLASLAGTDVDVFALTPVRGRAEPTLVAGRLPSARDEVALASVTLDRSGKHLGEDVLLNSKQRRRLRVVGELVPPQLGNATIGEAAVITAQGKADLGGTSFGDELWVTTQTDNAVATVTRLAGPGVHVNGPFPPATVARLDEIGNVDLVLLVFLAGLGIVVLVFHTVNSGRRQRRTTAIVRALGLRPRQVVATYEWQGAFEFAVAALFAVPVGVFAGRQFWEFSTRTTRVLNPLAVPVGTVAAAVAITAIAAAAGALLSAFVALRGPLSRQLRAE